VSRELSQLRFHCGERDRGADSGGPLETAVMEACARRGVEAAALLRGVTGFGAKHQIRTDRLLTLSEDAPLVAVAVGEAGVIEGLATEVRGMAAAGLLVVDAVQASTTGSPPTSAGEAAAPAADVREAAAGPPPDVVKVTIWGPRSGSGSPHLGAVAALHRCGAEAATVLLGVDGVLGGERRRARFFGANRGVPAITVAVGERTRIEAALGEVDVACLITAEPVVTYRRVPMVGHRTDTETPARAKATRTTLVTSETASHDGRPIYLELVDALRREGAPGATALRGVWGFRGGGMPRGDRVLALRRQVPILVEVVDSPERAARWRELALSTAGEGDVVESQPIHRILTLE
jgi:PII-like signaling protein